MVAFKGSLAVLTSCYGFIGQHAPCEIGFRNGPGFTALLLRLTHFAKKQIVCRLRPVAVLKDRVLL
jgi:hypothetical protein